MLSGCCDTGPWFQPALALPQEPLPDARPLWMACSSTVSHCPSALEAEDQVAVSPWPACPNAFSHLLFRKLESPQKASRTAPLPWGHAKVLPMPNPGVQACSRRGFPMSNFRKDLIPTRLSRSLVWEEEIYPLGLCWAAGPAWWMLLELALSLPDRSST